MRENGADRDSRADCLGYWTASLSTFPGRNLGCELALICIGSPVRGLRPVEALRRVTEKLPKPTNLTSSPRFRVDVITSSIVSTARIASLRLSPERSATWPISSCLFMDGHSLGFAGTRTHEATALKAILVPRVKA